MTVTDIAPTHAPAEKRGRGRPRHYPPSYIRATFGFDRTTWARFKALQRMFDHERGFENASAVIRTAVNRLADERAVFTPNAPAE